MKRSARREHSANIQSASVALAPILYRLCRDNEDLANRKGLTLRARRTGAIVMSDAILLGGILRNLINSARQALESFPLRSSAGFDPSRRPLPGTVVVRRAVDLLWHSIEVRSTVGWGSCFSILAEVAGARSERKAENSFAGGTQRRENVLPRDMFHLPHLITDAHEIILGDETVTQKITTI